jgi:protein-tyrosine phosphatase
MGASDSKNDFADIHEILPSPAGLFLSSRPPRLAEALLQKKGIGAILDVTCAHAMIEHFAAANSPWTPKMKYMNLPVFDTEESDLKRYFVPAIAFISDARKAGLGVLVHCEQGVSRSSSCVIAYLLSERNLSLIDAYREVVRCRAIALPNTSFLLQLMSFEQEQKGKDTDREECLLSVVLLERELVPGLKDLGVTHRHITRALQQHPANWPLAVRVAMNEAVGDSQAAEGRDVSSHGSHSGGESPHQACPQEDIVQTVARDIS